MTEDPTQQQDQQQDDQNMTVDVDGRRYRVGGNWKRVKRIDF